MERLNKIILLNIVFLFILLEQVYCQIDTSQNFSNAVIRAESSFLKGLSNSSNSPSSVTTETWTEYETDSYIFFDASPGFYYDSDYYTSLVSNMFVVITIEWFYDMQIRYDGGDWIDLSRSGWTFPDGSEGYGSEPFYPPWNTPGTYTIDCRFRQSPEEPWVNHSWPIHVVDGINHRYVDNLGNRMEVWMGGSSFDRPMVIAEGFDPDNETYPPEVYFLGQELFNSIRDYEVDVVVFNFNDGGDDIRDNASYLESGLNYLTSIEDGNELSILAGVSMGGVVARYALVESEDLGNPLPVSHFLSLDSPQRYAVVDHNFQDWVNQWGSASDKHALQSMAAKEMLTYNTFDPDGTIHENFLAEINDMGENGYPQNCINIGVAFSKSGSNPNSGDEWLYIDVPGPFNQHYYVTGALAEGGSWLPTKTTQLWAFKYISTVDFYRLSDPTFIPYTSALDIRSDSSMFEIRIPSSEYSHHDEFPEDVVIPVLSALGLLPNSTTPITFKTLTSNSEQELHGDFLIDETVQLTSPGTTDLTINDMHNAITLDQTFNNPFQDGLDWQHHEWISSSDNFHLKHEFWGWSGSQVAEYDKVISLAISSDTGINQISIKDPWYLENPEANPEDWIQPNTFHALDNSTCPVFLNQGGTNPNNLQPPYYSLRAPLLAEDGDGVWKVFHQWSGSGFALGNGTTATDPEIDVVFTDAGASVTAEYHTLTVGSSAAFFTEGELVYFQAPASGFSQSGFTKLIDPSISGGVELIDEGLSNGYQRYRVAMNDDGNITLNYIPIETGDRVWVTGEMPNIAAGTVVPMPGNSSVEVLDYRPLLGSTSQSVIFKSQLPNAPMGSWKGLHFSSLNDLIITEFPIKNLEIQDASIAMAFEPGIESQDFSLTLSNLNFRNCAIGLEIESRYNFSLSNSKMQDGIIGLWNRENDPQTNSGSQLMTVISNNTFENFEVPLILLNRSLSDLRITNNKFQNYNGYGVYLDGYSAQPYFQDDEGMTLIANNVFESSDNIAAITTIGRDPITIRNNLINLSATGGTGIAMQNNTDIGLPDISIPEGFFPAELADYGLDPYDLYDLPAFPYGNDPFPLYAKYYSVVNNTIIGGHNGIYLDLQSLSEAYHIQVQNNILLNPIYDPSMDQLSLDDLFYFTGVGIIHLRDGFNDIGYNLFFGQAEERVYLTVNWTSLDFEVLPALPTDIEATDPLLLSNFHPAASSHAIDAGNPDLNGENGDYSVDPDDQDPDGSRMDIGAFYYPQLTGTVTQNLVLSGEASLGNEDGDDVIIPAGLSLTVEPGTEVLVQPATRLLVNGSLYIQGTQDHPVFFTADAGETWTGIAVIGGVAQMDYCDIQSAAGSGLGVSNNTTGWIRNCNLHDNTKGLSLTNVDDDFEVRDNAIHHNQTGIFTRTSQADMIGNHVYENSQTGVLLTAGTSGFIANNEIDHNGNGVDFNSAGMYLVSSSPVMSKTLLRGTLPQENNLIHDNNGYGLYSSFTGLPNLGTLQESALKISGGFNHFYNNSNTALYRNDNASTHPGDPMEIPADYPSLMAEVNYWFPSLTDESAPGAAEYHGAVEWYPVAATFNNGGTSDDYEHVALLGDGLIAEQDAEYEVAIDFYQQFLASDPPNKDQMIAAMSGMDRCYGHLKAVDQWQVQLEEIAANFDKEEQQKLAQNYLIWVYKKLGLDAEAIAAAQRLIDDCSDPEYVDYYTLEIALLLYETDGSILAKISPEQRQVADRIQQAQHHLLTTDNQTEAARLYKLLTGGSGRVASGTVVPDAYALHPAYPNPFNPVTTIRYDLPEAGRVRVAVYDIRGRLVTTLTNEDKQPGSYHLQWQGKDASGRMVGSGLYFYTLEVLATEGKQTFRASRKMLLMK